MIPKVKKILPGLVLIIFTSTISAQCGCLEDIFENDPDGSEKIIKIFDGGFFTEGPTVDNEGNVYFTDLTFISETGNVPGHIWKYSPATGETDIYRSPGGMANGMLIDENDYLYICEGADTGGRRIIKTDLKTGKSIILADEFNGKPFNSPNDITRASDGTIYFSDSRYIGDEPVEQPCNGVYRLLPSGKVELIIDDITMPNGVAVTPDNKKLYVGCNQEEVTEDENMKNGNFIAEYLIDDEGKVTFNKYVAKFLPPTAPDGIELGNDGNIYAAINDQYRPGIYVYSAKGNLLQKIIMPETPSNLTFANKEQNELYVTASVSLYKVHLEK